MESAILIGTLAFFIAAGVVGFKEWRSRHDASFRYSAACAAAALLGLTALAYCFALGFVPAAIAVGAIVALSQQNRIENILVRGLHADPASEYVNDTPPAAHGHGTR
jgi:hypothetical protein